jgi:hypothetical protein
MITDETKTGYTFRVAVPGESEAEFTWDPTGLPLSEASAWLIARGDEAIRRAHARANPGVEISDDEVHARRDHVTVRNA